MKNDNIYRFVIVSVDIKFIKKMIEHNYFYHTLSNRDTSIFTMNANIERNVMYICNVCSLKK